jgi:hypothetical protein
MSNPEALQEGELQKCGCCKKEKFGCEYQESGAYYLCLACKSKITLRVAEARMQKYATATYSVTRSELMDLRADGLLPVRTYIFFALKIDFPDQLPVHGLDMAEFCECWQVTQAELMSAIGGLARKGIVYLKIKNIDMEVVSRKQRLAQLEKSLGG